MFVKAFLLVVLSLLPQSAAAFSCDTPQDAAKTHLDQLQTKGVWDPVAAAACFQLSDQNSDEAASLAIQLKQIMDARALYVDTDGLSQDPAYMDPKGIHRVQLHPNEKRVVVELIDGQWRFPADTVAAIPVMYKESFSALASTLKQQLPPSFHQPLVADLQGWQFVLFGVLLLASLLVGRAAQYLLTSQLIRVAERVRIKIESEVVARTQRPITWATMGAVFLWGLPDLQLSIGISESMHGIARVILSLALVLVVVRMVDVATGFWTAKAEKTETRMDDQLIPLVNRAGKIIVVVLGLLFVLQNFGVDVTSLLAGVTISGLAIALAAKDTVENLFGSAMIFIDRPFQIGDTVDIGGLIGTVVEVGFRSTRLRTPVGSIVSVPNGKIASSQVDNLGARERRRLRLTLGFTYDASREQIAEFITQVRALFEAEEIVDADHEVHFVNFGDSALEVMLHAFLLVPGWSDELSTKQDLYMKVWAIADELKLSFAFPSQSLYVESLPASKA
jgi:MscS family membrane protein